MNSENILPDIDYQKSLELMGLQIKKLRKIKKLSTADLSRLSYTYPREINRLENAKTQNPSLKTLLKISIALEVPLNELTKPLDEYLQKAVLKKDNQSINS